jgi:GTP-binding protein EngB required for normal cell division
LSDTTIMSGHLSAQNLRRKFKCFRILILGRANAGKTTILQKVCNTIEQPYIFDPQGLKVDAAAVAPTPQRGYHDIENAMIFKSNPGFVFHDSRGFEAGGANELGIVKTFIAKRAREKDVNDQLHVIWYCVPMDNHRPISALERSFFTQCGTGKVPVITIFTKMDGLDILSEDELIEQNMSEAEAKDQAPEHSLSFAKSQYAELIKMSHPPKGSVFMRNMHQGNITCKELIQETIDVLDDSNLRVLLVSTQQVSIEICIEHALKISWMQIISGCTSWKGRMTAKINEGRASLMKPSNLIEILKWFPHFYDYLDHHVDWFCFHICCQLDLTTQSCP